MQFCIERLPDINIHIDVFINMGNSYFVNGILNFSFSNIIMIPFNS